MSVRCRLDEEAVRDIARVADWYDAHAPGLGRKFIDEVERVVDRVARFPNAYARVHKSVRRARVARFPYFLAYQVFVGELVVVGLFAEAQHPVRVEERTAEE